LATQTVNLIGNRYELTEKLGSGGMGEVFKALDRLTGTHVALKRVLVSTAHLQFNTHSDSGELQLALAREFRVLASLRHPNIISVLDYGFDIDTLPFFTMTLLDNAVPLLGYTKHFTALEKIRLIIDLLQALAYLHRRGILHRDLKPNNIMVREDTLFVFDFGVALEYQQQTSKGIAGTLAYIAPEIFLGKPASPASDLFSVGVIVYQLLTGEHPFPSRSKGKVGDFATEKPDLSAIEAIEISTIARANAPTTPQEEDDDRTFIKSDVTTLDAGVDVAVEDEDHTIAVYKTRHVDTMREPVAVSGVSQGLAAIVGRLLDYDPAKRYQDALQVIQDLCTASGIPLPLETREIRESFIQSARFVGRVKELEELTYSLSQMLFRKKGVAWLIGGESGVGKSRLVDELRTQAMIKGALVVRGEAIEGGGLPYQLWRDVLPSLLTSIDLSDLEVGILKSILPNIGQILHREASNPPSLEGKAEQDRLSFAIADVFKRQKQTVVLIFEDLQWTIESLAPLKHLLQILDSLRLMIIGTYRSDERPDLPEDLAGMQVLALPRLGTAEITQLSASMLGERGTDEHIIELLQRETQGNVFFMVEVVRSLAEEAGRLQDIGKYDLPAQVITGGIQRILQRRLQRVPYEYQPLLKLAAVAGRFIDQTLLPNLAPSTMDLNDWFYRCSALAIIDVQDGQWRFGHDQLRDSLIATLSDIERVATHRQVAVALETTYPNDPGYAQVLAEHWYQAQDIPRAVKYTLQALEQLHRVSSFATARQLIARIMPLVQDKAQWLKLVLWAGEIELRLGDYIEAILHYQNAVERAVQLQDDHAHATALVGLAMASWRQGAYEDSQAYTEDAYELATRIGDLKSIASSLSRMGITAYSRGDYAKSEGVGVIGYVYTSPAARGRDYATTVTGAVTRELMRRGIDHVVLNVEQGNQAALRMYQKLGFRIHAALIDGVAVKK